MEPLSLLDELIFLAREQGLKNYDEIVKFVMDKLSIDKLTDEQRQELFTTLLKIYIQKHATLEVQRATDGLRKSRNDPHYVGKRGERIRNWWQEFLKTQVTVDGTQKAHADLTVDDLKWLSNDRAKRAEEFRRKSQEYASYAEALTKAGKDKLGDLTNDPLEQ